MRGNMGETYDTNKMQIGKAIRYAITLKTFDETKLLAVERLPHTSRCRLASG